MAEPPSPSWSRRVASLLRPGRAKRRAMGAFSRGTHRVLSADLAWSAVLVVVVLLLLREDLRPRPPLRAGQVGQRAAGGHGARRRTAEPLLRANNRG